MFKEIEFKYRADEVSLRDFSQYCITHPDLISFVLPAGYDHFYESKTPGSFCRHRVGPDLNQLTFKRKLDPNNNIVRTEHNLTLQPNMTIPQVAALVAEFGYQPNVSIFKTCFVYKFPKHTLVFYVCYDTEMKELGRFIEIEAEESHQWQTPQEALDHIQTVESHLSGWVTPRSRIKRSLFEMFRKDL